MALSYSELELLEDLIAQAVEFDQLIIYNKNTEAATDIHHIEFHSLHKVISIDIN